MSPRFESPLSRLLGPLRPQPVSPQPIVFVDVAHEGRFYRVALKRVASARRLTLRVRAAHRDVVLTLPSRGSVKAATAFAHRHAAWIAERVTGLAPGIAIVPDCLLPLRGVPHRCVVQPGLRRLVWVEAGETEEAHLCVSGPAASFTAAILTFLRREALADFTTAVSRHATAVGRPVRAIRLRDTRSRWGSCSTEGTLNFSWRMIMAPPHVLDYLAAHEVAHLVHMNHSAAFWAVTRRLAPRMDEAEAWLKSHGAGLHHYGA